MDPEPGHEDPDGPPPPPPEAVSRSASGWTPPSEPPQDRVGARGPSSTRASSTGPSSTGPSSTGAPGTDASPGQGWPSDVPGLAAAEDGGTWQVGAPPVAAGASGTRRGRRWPLVLSGLLLLGLAVTLVVLVLTAEDEGSSVADAGPDGDTPGTAPDPDDRDDGGTDGGETDPDDGGDGGGPGSDDGPGGGGLDPDADLDPLDLDALDGLDLVYGQLLTDIDASEREMIDFQTDVGEALSGSTSRDDGLTAVAAAAAERTEALGEVRDRLADPLDDPGAEEVRRLYVDHLDSWAAYIGAVAEDPLVIFEQSETGATVAINRTADRFARALEDELPDDADAEVARFADDILDRGFRGFGVADV